MIVLAHTKFGLVWIQGAKLRGGGGGIRPPRSERVFEIPVRVGLSLVSIGLKYDREIVRSKQALVYWSEKL